MCATSNSASEGIRYDVRRSASDVIRKQSRAVPVAHIDNPDDPRLGPYRQLNRRNPARSSGRFIAEGLFVVERLIASRFPVESILLTEERHRKLGEQLPPDADLLVVPRSIVKGLVGFDFHAGILACGLRQPHPGIDAELENAPEPLTIVVCPRTTDPVNLGNIIRLCCAFGVHALLLGPGCADPFSRRVLRVSMGNVFRLPIVDTANLEADLKSLKETHGMELAAMVLDPDASPLETITRPSRLALLFGHEGKGLGDELVRLCDHRWTIPMANGTDSLNVAACAAIVLYQLARHER
jgi:tRNA G18 (ribose-2'-O)-methylase SpoU